MKLLSPYVVLFLAYSPDIFPDLFQFSGAARKQEQALIVPPLIQVLACSFSLVMN